MTKDLVADETLTDNVSALLESFSEKDPAGKHAMSQLLASDPRGVSAAAIRLLAKRQPSAGSRYLVHLLIKEKLLPGGLLDPKSLDLEEAIASLRAVVTNGTNLQPVLELALNRALLGPIGPESSARILRLLDLLAAIAAASSWNAFQLELMAYPDKVVRSKAALLIGRSTKNAAWIGRRFLDRDPRVQASAVEALWEIEAAEARPFLLTASQSKHNRVAANAALGLHRISDLRAIPRMLEMARQPDPLLQISAYWAIGESQDTRFLPFLMEQFKTSQGKVRLAVTRALGSIRRREKAISEVGAIEIRLSQARAGHDGTRSIAFSLVSPRGRDFSAMKPTDFALWEGGALIEDYEVKLLSSSAVLAAGFVVPRFTSPEDPYARAVATALDRCSAAKRPDDLWRIDRYSIDSKQGDQESPGEKSGLPYDEAIMTQELKMRQSFIAARDLLRSAISAEVPAERAAPNSFRAIERQCAAIKKISAKRHVFMFLHHDSLAALDIEAHMQALKETVTNERIILHGFAPGPSHDCAPFRLLCQSVVDGTFSDATLDRLPDALEEIYPVIMSGCEINYRLAPGVEPGPLTLRISSSLGAGQADIALQAVAGP